MKAIAALFALIMAALVAIGAWLVTSGVVMLAVGAAHSHDDAVPALGFGATAFLTLAALVVVGAASSSPSK